MFLKEPISDDSAIYAANTSPTLRFIIGFAVVVTSISIVIIEPLLKVITSYVSLSGF